MQDVQRRLDEIERQKADAAAQRRRDEGRMRVQGMTAPKIAKLDDIGLQVYRTCYPKNQILSIEGLHARFMLRVQGLIDLRAFGESMVPLVVVVQTESGSRCWPSSQG